MLTLSGTHDRKGRYGENMKNNIFYDISFVKFKLIRIF